MTTGRPGGCLSAPQTTAQGAPAQRLSAVDCHTVASLHDCWEQCMRPDQHQFCGMTSNCCAVWPGDSTHCAVPCCAVLSAGMLHCGWSGP